MQQTRRRKITAHWQAFFLRNIRKSCVIRGAEDPSAGRVDKLLDILWKGGSFGNARYLVSPPIQQ